MPTWEVVDGNRTLVREFSNEEEAYRWVEQENARIARDTTAPSSLASYENAVNLLRVAIMGF